MWNSIRQTLLVVLLICFGKTPFVQAAATGTVSGTVKLKQASGSVIDPAGVVVYVEGVAGALPQESELARVQLHQRNLQFDPPLLVITQGTTVDFLNDDRVFHNVFSFSEAAKFDLGLYKSGTTKSVTFRKPGVINVYCNIHPEMISKIRVLDTTFFAVVGKDGRFQIDRIPIGTYSIVAWQSYGEEFRGQVTITSGGKASVSIDLTQGSKELRHSRKDGTPYGRYK